MMLEGPGRTAIASSAACLPAGRPFSLDTCPRRQPVPRRSLPFRTAAPPLGMNARMNARARDAAPRRAGRLLPD